MGGRNIAIESESGSTTARVAFRLATGLSWENVVEDSIAATCKQCWSQSAVVWALLSLLASCDRLAESETIS